METTNTTEQYVSHGSTITPGAISYKYDSISYTHSQIYVSNITEDTVQCTIKFIDNDGNDIGARARIFNGNQASGSVISVGTGTNTISIPPNGTRLFMFDADNYQNLFGYAVIEWASTNPKTVKALAGAHYLYSRNHGGVSHTGTPINMGQPF